MQLSSNVSHSLQRIVLVSYDQLLKENKRRDKMFKSILTEYIDSSLSHAEYDKLNDAQ